MQTRFSPLGLILFIAYLLFYAGFVFLNAFFPEAMELTPWAGLNLAILYGFALILLAVVMAVIYGATAGNATEIRPGKDEPGRPLS